MYIHFALWAKVNMSFFLYLILCVVLISMLCFFVYVVCQSSTPRLPGAFRATQGKKKPRAAEWEAVYSPCAGLSRRRIALLSDSLDEAGDKAGRRGRLPDYLLNRLPFWKVLGNRLGV